MAFFDNFAKGLVNKASWPRMTDLESSIYSEKKITSDCPYIKINGL